jgi:hypothetical protein
MTRTGGRSTACFDRLLPGDLEMPRYQAYHRRLLRHTRELVRRHRATIECIADLLLRHKTLTGPEVDQAMRRRQ